MIRYTGLAADAVPTLSAMARASFVETFGALYAPADLQGFLDTALSPDAYEAERSDGDYRFRLAWDGDALAGFAKLRPLRLPIAEAGPGAMELGQLYLRRPWQGAGIAPLLMDWAIAEARAAAAADLCLSVFVDNHRARRFYARYGFEDVGAYVFMVGGHADEDRLMRLRL